MNEKPIFEAFLTPHRSLGRKGFTVFAIIVGALILAHIVIFLIAKAWPVAIFLGLDLILIFGAFWLNYRAGRAREEIVVSRLELKVSKVSPTGKRYEKLFNPLWTKFLIDRKEGIGITDMKLRSEGNDLRIGAFLNPDDRESFARAFGGALATAKRR
ncbi:MAG: DUF2244 domain-containing protein [Lentilitoribacter sp.]